MSQNAAESVTPEQVQAAEAAEQAELTQAQLKHFMNRVVVLRVNVDELRKRLDAALAEIDRLKAQYPSDVEPEEGSDSEN